MRISKKCPRCGERCLEQALRCPDCGLVFSRLEMATNMAAKKMIKQGKKDKVVYVKKTPSDIKRWILIVYTVVAGFFGAHLFYVGRYIKASVMLALSVISLLGFVFMMQGLLLEGLRYFAMFFTAINMFMWLFDILDVCIFRFKIPVYIDVETTK